VVQRGTTWMVLGDDLASGDAVALPLEAIHAVAALPEDFDVDSVRDDDGDDGDLDDGNGDSVARKPWRPAPGQAPPAGHIRCPCGSGVRYRHCCRPMVTA